MKYSQVGQKKKRYSKNSCTAGAGNTDSRRASDADILCRAPRTYPLRSGKAIEAKEDTLSSCRKWGRFVYRLCFLPTREQPLFRQYGAFKSLFIDDLCVGQRHFGGSTLGEGLFEYVKQAGKRTGLLLMNFERQLGNTWQSVFMKDGNEDKGTADGIYIL